MCVTGKKPGIDRDLFQNDKDYRVSLVSSDPMLFAEVYLGHHMANRTESGPVFCPPAVYHRHVYDTVFDRDAFVMIHRGGGKSIIKGVFEPIYRICTRPSMGWLYVGTSQTVTKRVRIISDELKYNKALHRDFGVLLDDSCTVKIEQKPEIITRNKWHLEFRTHGSGVRGLRPDIVVVDDILDREEAKNPDLRQKVYELIVNDLWPSLPVSGSRYMLGTPMHPEDIVWLEWLDGDWRVRMRIPAESVDPETGERRSHWPERFPLEHLDKERARMERLVPGSYRQEYLLEPMISANMIWSQDMIRYWDKRPPVHKMVTVTGIDLALGVREENAETAIVTMGGLIEDHGEYSAGDFFELKSDVGHFKPPEIVHRVLGHCQEFGFRNKLAVEDKAAHHWFENDLRSEVNRRGYSMPAFSAYDGERYAKAVRGEDKRTRAESVIGFYQDKRVYHDPDSMLSQQMLNFTGRKKERNDAVDAAVHALRWFLGRKWYGSSGNAGLYFAHRVKQYGGGLINAG